MASTRTMAFDTAHEDMIHDAQLDYYGRRLATCSSDRTIKLFDVTGDRQVYKTDLRGHEGPVWRVAWAHPSFGSILASCSYDRMVFLWKETAENVWNKIHNHTQHTSSVNSIAWAPHELGLSLATASSDGSFAVLTHQPDDTWAVDSMHDAHKIGCNAVSWAPAVPPASTQDSAQHVRLSRRLVTGGCDHLVKIWKNDGDKWVLEQDLQEVHSDWVRDVAWAPNIGLPRDTIASCSQDGSVVVWTSSLDGEGGELKWEHKKIIKSGPTVWRVSWSIAGNVLAVSSGDNVVSLWKETPSGEWECVSTLDEPAGGASGSASGSM